tara:strand:- start:219 stop:611 length:393 start_codon:yes stop_codon:yes gene_type:complete
MSVIYPTNSHVANVVNSLARFYKSRQDFELIAFDYEAEKINESQYYIALTDMNYISVHLMHPKTCIVIVTFIEEDGYGGLQASETFFVNENIKTRLGGGWELNLPQFEKALERKYSDAHEAVNRTMENTV